MVTSSVRILLLRSLKSSINRSLNEFVSLLYLCHSHCNGDFNSLCYDYCSKSSSSQCFQVLNQYSLEEVKKKIFQ